MSALASPEQRVVLACARTIVTECQIDLIRAIAPRLDWCRVLDLACQHNTTPLLHRSLAAAGVNPPAPIRRQIEKVVLCNAARGRRLAHELVRLTAAFEQAGIRALPFKGAVLAASAYGNVALRPFNDLDVIVHPDDADTAARLLANRGFAEWGVAPPDLPRHLRCECEHSFARADGVVVDLHWRLSRRHFPFPLDFDSLWRRALPCPLWPGGPAVPNLGAADTLQVLCMHGTKHAWERLSWICDIAELLAANPALPWEFALEQAEALGATRMTLLGLELAAGLLDARLPVAARQRIAADRGIAALARYVRGRLFQPPANGLRATIRQSLFHLRVRNRPAQRLRYCMLAAAPTPRDLRSTPLPASLYFLYYLTRPVRLLCKAGNE